MKIVVYSDIQGIPLVFPQNEPDLVILTGDIWWEDVKIINDHFSCPIFGCLGNHDRLDTFKGTRVVDLHARTYEWNGYTFAGFGGCPIYNHKPNFPQYEEAEAQKFTRSLDKVDFFIAHSNPMFESPKEPFSAHRGFLAFKELLDSDKTKYFLHGHIHENERYHYKNTEIIVTLGMREFEV